MHFKDKMKNNIVLTVFKNDRIDFNSVKNAIYWKKSQYQCSNFFSYDYIFWLRYKYIYIKSFLESSGTISGTITALSMIKSKCRSVNEADFFKCFIIFLKINLIHLREKEVGRKIIKLIKV